MQLEHLRVKLTTTIPALLLIRGLLLHHLDRLCGVRQFPIRIETTAQFLGLDTVVERAISVDSDGDTVFVFVPRRAIWAAYRAAVPRIPIHAVSKAASDVGPASELIVYWRSWRYRRSESARRRCFAAHTAVWVQFTIWSNLNRPLRALYHHP